MDERKKTAEEAKAARRLIWQHNSFLGHCVMAQQNMQAIIDSRTATDEAKERATLIKAYLGQLAASLKERKPL